MFITEKQEVVPYFAVPGLLNDYKINIKPTNAKEQGLETILNIVSEYTTVSIEDMRGKNKNRVYTLARHIYFYFAKKYTRLPFRVMAEFLGGRDHTTAIHSVRTMHDLIETDLVLADDIKEIEKVFRNITDKVELKYEVIKQSYVFSLKNP